MNVVYMFNKVRALWKITWLETHFIGVRRVNQKIFLDLFQGTISLNMINKHQIRIYLTVFPNTPF